MLPNARRCRRPLVSNAAAFAIALVTLIGPAAVATADPGHGRGHGKADKAEKADKSQGSHGEGRQHDTVRSDSDNRHVGSGHSIGWNEAREIRRWFARSENLHSLPPGLAKRETLPPGLRKQLVRNGTLPPGLQDRLEPLPLDLDRRLPRLPDGVRRVIVGRDVLLVDDASRTIRDILRNVLAR